MPRISYPDEMPCSHLLVRVIVNLNAEVALGLGGFLYLVCATLRIF